MLAGCGGDGGEEVPIAARTEALSFCWDGRGKALSTHEKSMDDMVYCRRVGEVFLWCDG